MEMLKSENESLKYELFIVKTNSKMTSKQPVKNYYFWKQNMDEADDMKEHREFDDRDVIIVDKDGKATVNDTTHEKEEHDEEIDEEHERRRHWYRRSCSHSHVLESVQKELWEVRDLIQRIPGVPKPMEKAIPTSYIDNPFSNYIALVQIPKDSLFLRVSHVCVRALALR